MDREKPSTSYFTPGSVGLLTTRLGGPLLQFKLLRNGHIARFMQSTLGISPKSIVGPALLAVPGISRFSLGDLNEVASLLIVMYGIAGIRQTYWAFFTRTYDFHLSGAIAVGTINFIQDAVSSGIYLYLLAKAPIVNQTLGWKQYVALGGFVTGIALEMTSELSRQKFKRNPKNKGKIDDTGLWSVIRHVNYLGFTLWRSSIALATGSIAFGLVQLAINLAIFSQQAIGNLDKDMIKKYGAKWADYKRRVPYALIPGVY